MNIIKKLEGFTLKEKIYSLAAVLMAAFIILGAVSSSQMNSIGEELVNVAEKDIPLTRTITQITVHQLEMAVLFERAVRIGELMVNDASLEHRFTEVTDEFEALSHKIDGEIRNAEATVDGFIKTATSEENKKEFQKVRRAFTTIEAEHKSFYDHAMDIKQDIKVNNHVPDEAVLESVEAEADKVDHELEGLLEEIEDFTEKALLNAEHHEESALMYVITIIVVGSVIGLGVSYVVSSSAVKQVGSLVDVSGRLTSGEREFDVQQYPERTEFGRLSKALEVLRNALIDADSLREEAERLTREQEEAEQREQGRLTEEKAEEARQLAERTKLAQERTDKLDKLVEGFNHKIGEILQVVTSGSEELEQTSLSLTTMAQQAQGKVGVVASSTTEMSANVQMVATATEELSSSIGEISSQAHGSSAAVDSAVAETQKAGVTIQGLSESADAIGHVLELINDIADQTNLLALNATIEAARAGEAGKGFAVVASEVKNLAVQTGKATEDVSKQIDKIQADSTSAVDAVVDIEKVVGSLQEVSTAISGAVEEQNATTGEIARNITEVATASDDVSKNMEEINVTLGETHAASEQVLSTAQELAEQMTVMRSEVDHFISGVAAI